MARIAKTIIVTGCSHSTGASRVDKLIFKDYPKFLRDSIRQTLYQTNGIIWKHKIRYLLEKYKCRNLRKLLTSKDPKAANITQRYFNRLERAYSWPAELQKQLKGHKVINLAKSGNSFKTNVKNTLDFLKNIDSECIVIHQVPNYSRTYVKLNRLVHNVISIDDLHYKKADRHHDTEYCATLDELKIKYENLVRRDVDSNYFRRANKQYLKCLLKSSNALTKHFFITEENDQLDTMSPENIILQDFKNFRLGYKLYRGHVIDDKFNVDLVKLIIDKIQ